MKELARFVATTLAVGVIFVAVGAKAKTHVITARLVAIDLGSQTITVEDDRGEPKSLPVLGKAAEGLTRLPLGDTFRLTCEDDDKGEHRGITRIKRTKAAQRHHSNR
ncbi:MAG TPA: hypothetical protein VJS92_07990 [Candidatus Polarisedimenticolaceae bacterium]|nr:hypothetical protein [Candidatus Polarisedimenticolaceae bacterium]